MNSNSSVRSILLDHNKVQLIQEKHINRRKLKLHRDKAFNRYRWQGPDSHIVEILIKKDEDESEEDLEEAFKPVTGAISFITMTTSRMLKVSPEPHDSVLDKLEKSQIAPTEFEDSPKKERYEDMILYSDESENEIQLSDESRYSDDENAFYVAHYSKENKIVGKYKLEKNAIKKYHEIIMEETYSVAFDYFLLLDKNNLGFLSPEIINSINSNFRVKENLTFEKFHSLLVKSKTNIQQKRDEKYTFSHRRLYKRLNKSVFEMISKYRASKIDRICKDIRDTEDHEKNYIKAILNIFNQASEVSDIVSDLILAITIYRAGIVATNVAPYLVLTAVYMFSTATPYILSYSSGIQLMIKKGILNDESYKSLPIYVKALIVGMLTAIGPFFYVFLHIFDVFVGLANGLGTFILPQVQYAGMMKRLLSIQFSLGLNEMEYEGFLLQRKIAQVMFESLISFIINIIMLSSNFFALDQILSDSKATIIFSLCTTILNFIVQIFTLKLQSVYFEESFLNYCLVCMKARFGWIPFSESIERNRLRKNIDYSNLKFKIPYISKLLGIYLQISCEFSDIDVRTLKNAFEAFKINNLSNLKSDQKYEIKIGKVLKNVSIDAIAHLLVSIPQDHTIKVNLEGISWKSCIENRMKKMKHEKYSMSWEPVLPTGEHLLKVCIDSETDGKIKFFDMFEAILESGGNTDSYNFLGESILFYAVKTNKIESLKLLLKYRANPSIQNQFSKETPLTEAIMKKNLDMVRILLHEHSSPHVTFRYNNSEDITPLILVLRKLEEQSNEEIEKICELMLEFKIQITTQEEKDAILYFLQSSNNENHISLALNLIGQENLGMIRDSRNNNILHYLFRSLSRSYYHAFTTITEEQRTFLSKEKNSNGIYPVYEIIYCQNNYERFLEGMKTQTIDYSDEKLPSILYEKISGTLNRNLVEVQQHLLKIMFEKEEVALKVFEMAKRFRHRQILRLFKDKVTTSQSITSKLLSFISQLPMEDGPENLEAPIDIGLTHSEAVALSAEKQEFSVASLSAFLKYLLEKKNAPKRADMFERLILFSLEVIALFDFAGDMIVLIGLSNTNNIGWTTLTILSMLCPYLVSYAPLVTFFIERKQFKGNTSCWSSTTKALMMTPICIVYILILDLLYILFTIFIEPIDLIYTIVTCQKFEPLVDVDQILDKILSKSFGLKIMDAKGFKRLRSMSQLIFESIPQILLQIRILGYGSKNFGINVEGIIFSLVSAVVHATIEFLLLSMESKACKSSFLYYSVVSLNGRFNWVPFSEKFSTSGLSAKTELDYSKMSFNFLCAHFEMSYEFSNETLEIFTMAVRYLPEVGNKEERIKIKIGNTCGLDVSLKNINNAILAADNKVDLDVEGINFEQHFERNLKNIHEPMGPDGEPLIVFYAERDCINAVSKLLERNVNLDVYSKKKNIHFLSMNLKDEIRTMLLEAVFRSKSTALINKFYRAEKNLIIDETRKRTLEIAIEFLDRGKEKNAMRLMGLVGGFHCISKYPDYNILRLIESIPNNEKLYLLYKKVMPELSPKIFLTYSKQKYEIQSEDAEAIKGFRIMADGIPIGYFYEGNNNLGSAENPFNTQHHSLTTEETQELLSTLKLTKREHIGCGKCGKIIKFKNFVYNGKFKCSRCLTNGIDGGAYHCQDCQFDLCQNCYDICLVQKSPSCITCSEPLAMVESANEQNISCLISCWTAVLCKTYYKCSNHPKIIICGRCCKNMYQY